MTLKEAYDKIDNTLCLNSRKLEFDTENEGIDCKDVHEMIHCLDTVSDLVDIEEELGIDLITLYKAQTQGIWYLQFQGYDENGNNVYMPVKQDHSLYIDFKQKALVGRWIEYDFEDYKKKHRRWLGNY